MPGKVYKDHLIKRSCFHSSFFAPKILFCLRRVSFLFRQERHERTGQRGTVTLPRDTPFPFGIPQALLLQCNIVFRCSIVCSNDTERVREVTILSALCTHCLPALRAFLYLYCIAQKIPCFFHKDMLEFRLRKYGKNQFLHNKNSGFFRKKGVKIYVFLRLCMG